MPGRRPPNRFILDDGPVEALARRRQLRRIGGWRRCDAPPPGPGPSNSARDAICFLRAASSAARGSVLRGGQVLSPCPCIHASQFYLALSITSTRRGGPESRFSYNRRALHNPMPIQSGARLGPYEVLAKLGEGGMGEVYSAPRHAARSHRRDQGPACSSSPPIRSSASASTARRARSPS